MTSISVMLHYMGDTTARILDLLSLLQTHREWSGRELAGRLGVSERTIRRDVDKLRELGYPVDATPGYLGGYRLQAGASLPPLLLDDDEAVAITLGLRNAAGGTVAGIEETSVRALAKLEQVLPKRLRRRVNALQNFTVPLIWSSGPTVDSEVLIVIAQACRDCDRLRFDYTSRDSVDSHRLVEPHRLVPAGRKWYLVAWDVDRGDWRTFRVDRLDAPRIDGVRFNPRELPAEDAAAFVAQAIASTPFRYQAVATLHASAEQATSRIGSWGAQVEEIDAGSCIVRLAGDSLEWMAFCFSLVGADFEIREPAELVDYAAGLASRLQRAARPA